MWRRQAESYSPVWPKGTPRPPASPANACTLSWSMDDMLEALMAARAGWRRADTPTRVDALAYARTRSRSQTGGGGGGTLQKSSCDSQTWLLLHGRDGQTGAAEENRKSGEHGRTQLRMRQRHGRLSKQSSKFMNKKDNNKRNIKQSCL